MSSNFSREILMLPQEVGIRVAAIALLDDAHVAAKALESAHDPEALHDFRVALRRLRSWLRAFKIELSDGISRKQRRRLRDIAKATNAGRDVEMQLEWLRDASKARSKQSQRGAKWMLRHLKAEADGARDTGIANRFRDVRDDLEARLSICSVSVRQIAKMPSLGAAIAERIPTHSAALDRALAKVQSADDDDAAHQARIATKRLRYLIEPGASLVTGGATLLKSLKRLQLELGVLHDAHLVVREIGQALDDGRSARTHEGLEALNANAHKSVNEAFASVRRGWLRGRYARVDRSVTRFASRLELDDGVA